MERQPSLGRVQGGPPPRPRACAPTYSGCTGKTIVALVNTARAYLEFWQGDLSILFRKEEEVLLPVLARHAGSLEEPVMQMLVQHASVRGLVMQLSDEAVRGEVRRETLRRLGGRPEDHVRLEDHVVLPLIEETLPSCLDKLLPSCTS